MTDRALIQALVARRVARGWNHAELARRMGVSELLSQPSAARER